MEEISSQTEFSQSLLKSLNPQHLKSLLKVSSMDEIPSIKLDKAIVIVASIEAGGSLLKSRRLLRELLQTLENIELKNIANTYCNKVYDKPFDNALIISKLSEPVLAKILFQVLDSKLAVALQGMGISISPPNVEKAFFSVSTKSLLPHQEAVVAQSLNMIEEKKNFLIQMPTGAGKTTTALMTLIRSGILNDVFSGNGYGFWIAPTNELLDQAKDTFLSLWARYGNREGYIYSTRQQSGSEIIPIGVLVFATYQSVAFWDDSELTKLYSNSNAIILADEAHRSIAPTYQKAIDNLTGKGIRIGLTATPGRKAELSKENIKLSKFFGSQIIRASDSGDEIADLQSQGILSKMSREIITISSPIKKLQYSYSDKEESDTDEQIESSTLKKLAENDTRNKKIIDIIERAVETGHRAIFFACSVDHSRLLCASLLLRGIEAASIDSLTPGYIRSKVVNRFRSGEIKVLGNYTVFSAGFDAPGTDYVVITRPTTSIVTYSQMIGRALRGPKMGGASKAKVIEFSDSIAISKESNEIYSFFDNYWE